MSISQESPPGPGISTAESDHARIASQFAQMFLRAAAGDHAAAREGFNGIKRWLQPGLTERRIRRIIDGEVSIAYHEDLFFVGSAAEDQRKRCSSALGFLRSQGIESIPVILVQLATTASDFAATMPIVSGVAYACLSGGVDSDAYAAAVHEFAHAHIRSGNRFLDEGAAYYFELRCQNAYPAVAADCVSNQNARARPLRTLLAYDAADDPYFDLLLSGNGKLIHSQAALLFGYLV
jgi:hypothetical protein